ncbi:MAG TPA: hypothetical protein VHN37_15995 [Actinomycetota bacterium]|nr:hypothetical protein [Actinomycetota bacterium]
MLSDVIGDLACTVCGTATALTDGAVVCRTGHSFDVARHGYVSMVGGRRPPTGDSADMVAARARFLGAGHFEPLERAVVAAATSSAAAGCVVDLGAGTGHYLARVLDALAERTGIALDSSPAALRRAARCHPRAAAVGCDVWSTLPVRTGAAAVVLDVFAPRNADETIRILAPGGVFVVAAPTEAHLRELVEPLDLVRVDDDKERRIEDALRASFVEAATELVEHDMRLSHDDVSDLVGMGPSARHAPAPVTSLPDPATVTCSVRVSTFVARP